jgi:large subunit ribosomal protein L4
MTMKIAVTTLTGAEAGSVELDEAVFGLEPRVDILHRMVRYQLAKRQQGTHQAQERSTINRTTKKMYKQKGTGGARHGSAKAPQFRGGGRAFGPVTRSHAHDLPKQVRVLALKHALSAKLRDGGIVILDKAEIDAPKTKGLVATFGKMGWANALIIGGAALQNNFVLAARNIPNIDVLPVQGINVYDILRREKLVLTTAALEALNARFAA